MDADRLYTYPEVARYLRVSLSTVKRLVEAGQLDAIRIGERRRVVTGRDLAAYVDSCRDRRAAA